MTLPRVEVPFSTSARDPLTLIDAYNSKGSSVNPIASFGNENIIALTATVLSDPKRLKDTLLSLVNFTSDNTGCFSNTGSSKTRFKRLSDLAGNDLSVLNNLSPCSLQELLEAFDKGPDKTYYKYNNNKVYSDNTNYSRQTEYSKLLSTVITDPPFEMVDSDAQESLYGHLINESIKLNNVEVISDLMDKTTDPVVKDKLFIQATQTAFTEMQLDSIAKLIEIGGVDKVNIAQPKSTLTILKRYKSPKETPLTPTELSDNLLSLCNQLEPLWYRYLRIGGDGKPIPVGETEQNQFIDDLSYYVSASNAALDLLKLSSVHTVNATLARDVKQESILNVQKRFYPYTLIKRNVN